MTSSRQLETEISRYPHEFTEEQICKLCNWAMELEERYVSYSAVCLFKQGFGPPHKLMEYKEQWYLALFFLELNYIHGIHRLYENYSTDLRRDSVVWCSITFYHMKLYLRGNCLHLTERKVSDYFQKNIRLLYRE